MVIGPQMAMPPDHAPAPSTCATRRARRDAARLSVAGLAVAMAAASAALSSAVRAQSPARDPGAVDQSPRVVDQVGDRNSLSHSLRVMPVDLSPHGFERVYAVPGRDDLLMRTNGALYAVFDQSTYTRDPQKRGALRAVIPAATVFYIGRPDFRTIRSTGMRDLDFVPGDASRAARPSSALGSMHGVTRLEGAPIDGRAKDVGAQIVDGRAHHPQAAPDAPNRGGSAPSGATQAGERGAGDARPDTSHEGATDPVGPGPGRGDGRASAPAAPGAADPRGTAASPAPAPRAMPAPPPPPLREEQPGFRDRIDELLRRAKKPS